jgi:hypothetical protein
MLKQIVNRAKQFLAKQLSGKNKVNKNPRYKKR